MQTAQANSQMTAVPCIMLACMTAMWLALWGLRPPHILQNPACPTPLQDKRDVEYNQALHEFPSAWTRQGIGRWSLEGATRKFTAVARLCPTERVSSGCTSEGMSHPIGPQLLKSMHHLRLWYFHQHQQVCTQVELQATTRHEEADTALHMLTALSFLLTGERRSAARGLSVQQRL